MTLFKKFSVIPRYCFDCYKVLIAPRTVMEFFKVLMTLEKVALPLDNSRKFMVEIRDDCSGTYKCYVYCRGIKEEGSAIRKIVQKVVAESISSQVPVSLKRGCSEYAHTYPGYARTKPGGVIMQYKKDWQAQEDFYDKNYVFRPDDPKMNADSFDAHADGCTYTQWEVYCLQFWLSYAATIGDTSYLAITGTAVPADSEPETPAIRDYGNTQRKKMNFRKWQLKLASDSDGRLVAAFAK